MNDRSVIEERSQKANEACPAKPACPVCGGPLVEIRAKLQCSRCRTICETCCEGGRGERLSEFNPWAIFGRVCEVLRDANQKAAFVVGEGIATLKVNFGKDRIHPLFLGGVGRFTTLATSLRANAAPAFQGAFTIGANGRRSGFEARVSLRKVVSERPFLVIASFLVSVGLDSDHPFENEGQED